MFNLPLTLSIYCHQPQHRYATRYSTAMNYVIPRVATDRSKGSIKFSGPKAWANVPKNLKDIAFRKPFTKKVKEHKLTTTFVQLPPVPESPPSTNGLMYTELAALFQSDGEESDFEGFDTPDLNTLFLSESEDEDFLGF